MFDEIEHLMTGNLEIDPDFYAKVKQCLAITNPNLKDASVRQVEFMSNMLEFQF